MVKKITDASELQEALQEAGDKLVVVDFFATWCGPCKLIEPQLEEMSNTIEDVVFLKVDVDESEELSTTYNINAMPTFTFFKNENRLDEMLGANLDKLKELIEKYK